jgi:hypothetical protein
MPEDHYIAKTFLKHFTNASGMLNVVRKSDGFAFPSRPRDICKEKDGDIIPDFLTEPAFLGKYRATFEPEWNRALRNLLLRNVSPSDKLNIAGYWANLLVCTPAWRRVGITASNNLTLNTIRSHVELHKENGHPDEKLEEAIKAIEAGHIKISTEANYIRAQSAINVVKYAWILYNADWIILENNKSLKFISSDNPAIFEEQNDHWKQSKAFFRFLSVTPETCIMCDIAEATKKYRDVPPNFALSPRGRVGGVGASLRDVKRVNVRTAMCAENLLISTNASEYLRDLARKYSKFRIDSVDIYERSGNGHYVGHQVKTVKYHRN